MVLVRTKSAGSAVSSRSCFVKDERGRPNTFVAHGLVLLERPVLGSDPSESAKQYAVEPFGNARAASANITCDMRPTSVLRPGCEDEQKLMQ